jgi:hypothetical protein
VVLGIYIYSKTCLKRNAIVPVFFFRFHRFPFYKGLCFNWQVFPGNTTGVRTVLAGQTSDWQVFPGNTTGVRTVLAGQTNDWQVFPGNTTGVRSVLTGQTSD